MCRALTQSSHAFVAYDAFTCPSIKRTHNHSHLPPALTAESSRAASSSSILEWLRCSPGINGDSDPWTKQSPAGSSFFFSFSLSSLLPTRRRKPVWFGPCCALEAESRG